MKLKNYKKGQEIFDKESETRLRYEKDTTEAFHTKVTTFQSQR